MYKHTQIGWVIVTCFVVIILWTGYVDMLERSLVLLWVLGLFLVCLILFGTLTVACNHRSIRVWFGPGLIRKTFSLDDIVSSTVVRNRWWYGWGIRKLPRGWVFNVSGLDAVELLTKSGKIFRIGTDEPRKLNNFLQTRLSEKSK